MRATYFLVIFIIVAVFYGVIPYMGAFYSRHKWRLFRQRFIELGLAPLLDYSQYRSLDDRGGLYRFTGEIESITDDRILWVRGEYLTIPVSLEKTKCFLLPKYEGEGVPEAPELIHWNRVSTLTEGVKVFIGGQITIQDSRMSFVSTKEMPLIVIFYNCPDTELSSVIIRAARTSNNYWNNITPVSLISGAFALVYIAASLLNRPAFRLIVISALVAVFIPVLPIIPPGLLFTAIYSRLTWHSEKFKTYWDMIRLPLRHLKPGEKSVRLSTGETYGFVKTSSLPAELKTVPWLIPELQTQLPLNETDKNKVSQTLYFFGVLSDGESQNLPKRSRDPFVSFGIMPESLVFLSRRYAIKAYSLEIIAWLIMMMGIVINIFFVFLIISLLGGF